MPLNCKRAFVLLFLALIAHAQEQKRVAILNTEDDGEPQIELTDVNYLTGKLREIALKTLPQDKYSVMSVQSIIDKLGSLENARKVCKEAQCLAQIGQKISAYYIGQARLGRTGGNLTINMELYNSGSGILIDSFTGKAKDVLGLETIIDEKAQILFKKLYEYSPEALYNRGNAYADEGNYDKAIEDYTAALKIKPNYSEALASRSSAYSYKGNYELAIEDCTAALKIKSDYPEALNCRGDMYSDKGNYDQAIKDYSTALKIKPNYSEALASRGGMYSQKGNYDQAIKDYT